MRKENGWDKWYGKFDRAEMLEMSQKIFLRSSSPLRHLKLILEEMNRGLLIPPIDVGLKLKGGPCED